MHGHFPQHPNGSAHDQSRAALLLKKRAVQGAGRREWLALSKVRNAAGHVFKRNPPRRRLFWRIAALLVTHLE